MLAISLLVLAYAAPPVPPPDADRLALATLIWQQRLTTDRVLDDAFEVSSREYAIEVLARTRLKSGAKLWRAKVEALSARMRARLARDRPATNLGVATCLADGLARDTDLEHLRAAKAFVETPAGRSFWQNSWSGSDGVRACFRQHFLDSSRTAEDLLAIGVKPPKEPPYDMNIVY